MSADNNFNGCGRICTDIDIREKSTSFTLVINRSDEQRTPDYIKCVAFGSTKNFIDKYLKKGNRVLVQGLIQYNSYKDKNGKTVSSNYLLTNSIMNVSEKTTEEERSQRAVNREYKKAEKKNEQDNVFNDYGGTLDIQPDDLPF